MTGEKCGAISTRPVDDTQEWAGGRTVVLS